MADASAELAALAEEFYSVWFRYRPDCALTAGVPGYEGLLPMQDDDEIAALAGWLETLVLALEEIDCSALDAQDRVDWFLMHTIARFEHGEVRDGDLRWRDPLRFLPTDEIYRLTLSPPETMRDGLGFLLAAIPEYLRHAQGRLREVASDMAPLLVRAAAREAEGGRCFIRELIQGSWMRRHWHSLSDLESLAGAACDALADYRALLLSEVLPRAAGVAACGADQMGGRLAGVHFIDCDPLELGPVLDAAASDNENALAELARSAGETVESLLDRAASRCLGGDAWIQAHGELSEALAGEIAATGLVSLPSAELNLGVRPACPRPLGFRADYLPDGESSGTLFLAEPLSGAPCEPMESIRQRCLDKGWGGSHLIAFSAPGLARRLPRRVADGVSLTAGWGLYLGYRLARASAAPPERLAWCLARRRALILLARIDLAFHVENLAETDAMERLRRDAVGTGAESALARIAARPGDALVGVLGWRLIEEAGRQWERDTGSGIDPRRLHDQLVGQGEIPLPLALCYGLGKPMWDAVRDRVLVA